MTDKSQAMSGTSATVLNLPKDQNEAIAEMVARNAPHLARMRKKLFDEYVTAGFTVDQALQLCVK